jgi:hypothetical protein
MKEKAMKAMIVTLCLSLCAPVLLAKQAPANDPLKDKQRKEAMAKVNAIKAELLAGYSKEDLTKEQLSALRKRTLDNSGTSVPALIEVMKSSKYPDKNRWVATFLLGMIMGEKSSAFISKFLSHPNWVMRMASLKTLLALKQEKFSHLYIRALKDQSLLVRTQALENIKRLQVKDAAPHVWAMLYDKKNYYSGKKTAKRGELIREAVKTVGDLKFEKARDPLFTMVQKPKYQDIFDELDYSLSKLTGKKSPEGDPSKKRDYWKKIALSYKTF